MTRFAMFDVHYHHPVNKDRIHAGIGLYVASTKTARFEWSERRAALIAIVFPWFGLQEILAQLARVERGLLHQAERLYWPEDASLVVNALLPDKGINPTTGDVMPGVAPDPERWFLGEVARLDRQEP